MRKNSKTAGSKHGGAGKGPGAGKDQNNGRSDNPEPKRVILPGKTVPCAELSPSRR